MPIAIVTGGNSGIGRAIAVRLAAGGHDVGITWHEAEEAARTAIDECRAHGVAAEARRMDLDVEVEGLPAAAGAVAGLIDLLGGVDVFVNNAGAGHSHPFLELDLDTWQRVVNLNLTGAFLCAQVAARRMVAQGRGGRIVNITSVHEHVPLQGSTAYVSAKHALGGMTKNMALELAEHGISVNAVAPGETATKMTDQEDRDPSGEARPGIPAGRPGNAHEVAAAVAWLASPDARYTTGQSIAVDGGMLLMAAMANQFAG